MSKRAARAPQRGGVASLQLRVRSRSACRVLSTTGRGTAGGQKFRTGGSALRDPETLFPCFECVQGYEGSTLFFGLSHHDTKRPVTKLLSTNKIEQSGLSVNFEHFTNKISFELRSRGSGQGMPHPRAPVKWSESAPAVAFSTQHDNKSTRQIKIDSTHRNTTMSTLNAAVAL